MGCGGEQHGDANAGTTSTRPRNTLADLTTRLGEVEGEGEGETPEGCPASKSDFIQGVKDALGDLFLMGLGMMVLFAHGRFSRRASASNVPQPD